MGDKKLGPNSLSQDKILVQFFLIRYNIFGLNQFFGPKPSICFFKNILDSEKKNTVHTDFWFVNLCRSMN